jgi:hypothetical protein
MCWRSPKLATALVGFAGIALLATLPAGAALLKPTAVIRSAADENHATAGWSRDGTVEYVAFSRRDPQTGRTNAFLRKIRSTGAYTTVKLNAVGEGDVGGIFQGRRVVYAQTKRGSYDLRIFDIPTSRRWAPSGVNTTKDEWLPTRSGRYLLFNRDNRDGSKTRVVLRDLKTSTAAETVLASSSSADEWVYAGQVRGSWAVWTKCTPICDAYKRDLAAGVTIMVPKPGSDPPLNQYDASVTADGTVYAVRSGAEACGSTVAFVRFGPSDPAEGTVIAELASGRFTTMTHARGNQDGSVDLFFARGSCTTFKSDIFKLNDPPSSP